MLPYNFQIVTHAVAYDPLPIDNYNIELYHIVDKIKQIGNKLECFEYKKLYKYNINKEFIKKNGMITNIIV